QETRRPDKRSASGSFAFVRSLKRRSYAAFVGINRRMQGSRRIRHKQSALCKSFEAAQLRRLPSGRNFVNLRNA
ncbi:hypothetical protein QU845_25405, partial [Escherichia coli]|nr:hypothetical protein [Escherichia coli]